MREFLMSLIPWGTDAIVWVQGFRTAALDSFFKAVTLMGQQEFYLLVLPLVYWAINKPLGARLACALLPGVYLNNWLKDLFFIPRPDPARVARLVEETTFAFPSGHAQNSTVLFGFLAAHVRRWLPWVLSVLLIGGTGLSRIYLGVHYPQDVVGGFLLGAIYLALFLQLEKPVRAWFRDQSLGIQLLLMFSAPILLLLLHPTRDTTAAMGSLVGFGVACILEREWVRFDAGGPWWQRVLRFLVGLALALLAYLGLRAVFPEGFLFRAVRYGCVGLTIGLFAPWVFVKTGLAASDGQSITEATA